MHSSYTKENGWYDEHDKSDFTCPVSKGQRAIVVHAGYEKRFIQNALLIFKSGTKSGDYHNGMNFENYYKWLQKKLIINLSEKSVVVIDNASYHNVQLNPAPVSSTPKSQMID